MPDIELQTLVDLHFSFLVIKKGYKCTESTPFRVRFESSSTFVELIYDGDNSFEIGLLVGKLDSQNLPFSIDEILRLRHAPRADSFMSIQVTNREIMARWIEKLAAVLIMYGNDFIEGNESSFGELAAQRCNEAKQYALERELKVARRKAEVAWHDKDYVAVVKALTPLRAALTATEVGRLEFAEKQFRGPN